MKKINWKLRLKNPYLVVPFLLFLFSTIGSIAHVTNTDLATWDGLIHVLKNIIGNPAQLFAIAFAVYGHFVDPTTKGATDSEQALSYSKPKEDK